jgi:hypothetical protein
MKKQASTRRGPRQGRAGLRIAISVLAAALLSLYVPAAGAQLLERIEVSRINGLAEIRISFGTQIQYLRHGPAGKGKELNVFVQRIPSGTPEPEAIEETLVAPQTDIVPRFTVVYPRLGNAVTITFAQETSWDVKPGPDNRSLVIVVPVLRGARDVMAEVRAAPAPAPAVAAAPVVAPTPPAPEPSAPPTPAAPQLPAAPPPQVPPAPAAPAESTPEAAAGPTAPLLTPDQIESMAKGFMEDARKALEEKDLARAINRLNRTLGLPTNAQTEAAQALIGEVRELSGEYAKARAEYELYLKLYPKGPDAPRIQERLAALPKEAPRAQARSRPLQRGPAEWTYYGSLSQYYYTGKSHIEITTPPPPGLLSFTTDVLSQTDQDALITNLDLNARRRDGITDTRIVLRDTDTQNYLDRSRSYNRLYSAYVEQSDRQLGYFLRAGRQTPTGGGVLERFDGLNLGYNFGERWRVNGVAGYAVEFMSPYKKDFYGASVEMLPQPDQLGVGVYALQQRLDGELNRQAVGLEARYFDMHSTAYGMLDYDTLYKGVNIAMLQGNYRSDGGTNYFTYIDHRKSPPYSLTNALAGLGGTSLKDAIATMGLEQVRADAKALTATSNMFSIGLTHPWSPRWLLGADYRAAEITATQATATMPAMPGSGLNHVVTLQAIGTNLMGNNDVGVINGSYIKGATYKGQAVGGNYVYLLGDAWRFDLNLRYYQQRDDLQQKQVRTSPSLKIGYRWEPVTIEAEAGQENVKVDGPTMTERSNRKYMFIGYRLDLR